MKIRITPGFVLLTAAWYLFDPTGLFWCAVPAIALHECGHLLAIRAFGGNAGRLTLSAAGLRIDYRGALSYPAEFGIAVAGAAANLLCALACGIALRLTGRTDLAYFAGTSLLFAAVNLIPASPLDGGEALRAVLYRYFGPETAPRVFRTISIIFSAALFIFGLYIAFKTRYNSTVMILGGLLLAGNTVNTKEWNPLWTSV